MKNNYYHVDGFDVRLLDYAIYAEYETVRVFFSSRHYDIKYIDMPEVMRQWIPISDGEFVTKYDHLSAEAGLKPVEDIVAFAGNQSQVEKSNQPTPHDVLKGIFIKELPDDLSDLDKILKVAQETILNLKDPKSGVSGAGFVAQANAIASLLDKAIKAKKTKSDFFNQAAKFYPDDDSDSLNKKKGGN